MGGQRVSLGGRVLEAKEPKGQLACSPVLPK